MCGLLNDAFDFVKDSAGEIFSHPGEAAGAAFGVPGFDPFFGGLFNTDHSLISPTGNFTSSAWNDMYNANPGDSGALGLFHGVNDVADKVAPAVAGYFAGPALAGAMGGDTGAAGSIGADSFGAGLGDAGTGASSLGGLESGMGGAALFGPSAGTGTAIGSAAAQGLGAGGLGIAGGDTLGAGLAGTGGTYTAGLGGSSGGTGLTSLGTGGAQVPGNPSGVGDGSISLEGGQAAPMPGGNAAAAGATGQPGQDLSALYGPGSTAAGSPMGSSILGSTPASTVSPYGATLGQDLSQGAAGGGILDTLKSPQGIQDLFKLGQQGLGAYQQYQKGQAAKNYAGSISSLFGPNSPYAQQMQQTLARQDAAAGRNSQYGTRATQLAAALTQAQANALGNNNYAQAAQNTSGSNMLNGLFGLAGTNTGQRLIGQGFNSLSNLFSGA